MQQRLPQKPRQTGHKMLLAIAGQAQSGEYQIGDV
jgi:hypothetical protein